MDQQNRKPLTDDIREEKTDNVNKAAEQAKPVPVYAERAETVLPEADEDELKALALSYARYLAEHNLHPGEPTFTDSVPDDVASEQQNSEQAAVQAAEQTAEQEIPEEETNTAAGAAEAAEKNPAEKKTSGTRKSIFTSTQNEPDEEELRKIEASLAKSGKKYAKAAALMDLHDRLQSGFDSTAAGVERDFTAAIHRITSTYRQSRRVIGIAILVIGILAALVLVIFDRFTVYEYSYNGKVLGYVDNQEDVTDVLDIAGTMLTENSSGENDIRFTANQNVTFRQVDARGKSTDDADTAVNKLVYMTDIETEASGVYDGNALVAIVKSSDDAEELLLQTRDFLSTPDKGMELVSADFTNNLEIRPVNVLLTSVQSKRHWKACLRHSGRKQPASSMKTTQNLQLISFLATRSASMKW